MNLVILSIFIIKSDTVNDLILFVGHCELYFKVRRTVNNIRPLTVSD